MEKVEKFYSVKEFAEKIAFDPQTVRRMIREGKINAFKMKDRGPYRVPESEIERLLVISYQSKE